MEEVKDPVAGQAKTGEEEGKSTTVTLEEVARQNKELNDKLEKVLKQNSDKDSFISKLQSENKEKEQVLQKLSDNLSGKSERQKDAVLDGFRKKMIDKGYDPEAVEDLIDLTNTVSERKAQEKVVPLIMEAAQELVESDSEIDNEFLNKNQDDITAEYNNFKAEVSPRKIKQNLKKAYKIVKERLAEKAKPEAKREGAEDRERMLAGAKSPGKASKEEVKDDFLDRIDKAGSKSGHFV